MSLIKGLLFLGVGVLVLVCPPGALAGQSGSQTGSQAPKTATPTEPAPAATVVADISTLTDTTSLAEAARLARSKKPGAAKPTTVVLDDDNFHRDFHGSASGADDGASSGSGNSGAGGPGRSKLVLLDFWASWCGPCRAALPGLKRLQASYGDQLQVVSISADHDEVAWKSFVVSHDMTWEQQWDADGTQRAKYGVSAFPTYILMTPDGKILRRLVGEDPAQSISERLGATLKVGLEELRSSR